MMGSTMTFVHDSDPWLRLRFYHNIGVIKIVIVGLWGLDSNMEWKIVALYGRLNEYIALKIHHSVYGSVLYIYIPEGYFLHTAKFYVCVVCSLQL